MADVTTAHEVCVASPESTPCEHVRVCMVHVAGGTADDVLYAETEEPCAMVVPLKVQAAYVLPVVVTVVGQDQPVMHPAVLYVGIGEADCEQVGAYGAAGQVITVVCVFSVGGVYVVAVAFPEEGDD